MILLYIQLHMPEQSTDRLTAAVVFMVSAQATMPMFQAPMLTPGLLNFVLSVIACAQLVHDFCWQLLQPAGVDTVNGSQELPLNAQLGSAFLVGSDACGKHVV